MDAKKLFIFFALHLFIISCTPQSFIYKEPLKEDGEVIVYIQPLPEPAERLSFVIDAITIVRDDETVVPISLSLNEIKGENHIGVQRLLGSTALPEGEYRGMTINIRSASLTGREGGAALLVSGEPLVVNHVFRVKKGKASTLFLNLEPAEFISEGFVFKPAFTLSSGGRELFTLTGYITNTFSNTVSVFNKKTMLNVGTISTGKGPRGIVLDQDRGRAYVAVSGDDVIEVIDVFSGHITKKISLNAGDEPIFLALAPDGDSLVSVNAGSNTVSIIDTGVLYETGRIRVGEEPTSAAVDPLGLRVYVTNSMSSSVSVIDLSSKTLAATIAVEGTPLRGAFSRRGDRFYVVNSDIPDLTVMNTSSLSVTGKIFTGTGALSVKVDTRTDLILVGNKTGGGISIIDPFSSMFIDTVRTDGTAVFMTIDDQENTLFAVIPGRKVLRKINLTSKKVIAEIDIGEGAYAVAVMGER